MSLFGAELGSYYWAARDLHLDISQARWAYVQRSENRVGKRRCLYPGIHGG